MENLAGVSYDHLMVNWSAARTVEQAGLLILALSHQVSVTSSDDCLVTLTQLLCVHCSGCD